MTSDHHDEGRHIDDASHSNEEGAQRAPGEVISVDAGGWGLTWAIDAAGCLRQIGLGPGGHRAALDLDPHWYPDAHPVFGTADPYRPSALRITHHDGTLTTRLRVHDVTRVAGGDDDHLVVTSRDEMFDLTVEHHVRAHRSSAVLEQWIEVHHDEPGPVRLTDYDSLSAFMVVPEDAELCHFVGSGWADEWRWNSETLAPGTKVIESLGGLQPHLQTAPCILLSPQGPAGEHDGEAIGLSIAWGGNTRFALDVHPSAQPEAPRSLRLRAGANPTGAEYVLDPGGRFVTPTVAWTWSASGRAEVSRRFHRWTLDRVVRDPHRLRPLVVNNWEATFFDFDEERIVDLIGRSADLDADVFLLDDGWFGTDHPRDDDTAGLGDWDPDPIKLPSGLAPLAEAAEQRGMRFGIWVEPEMVNRASTLFATHPEWVLRDAREPREHRNQLALDPLLAEVREFEVEVLDRTLAAHDHISYVKWDANRPITDPGSGQLAADRRANLGVDHVLATWNVMAEVSRRHPEVEMMLCASGGGRTDHGTLRWFHEFWTSDNTDPVTRVRMQWACSHFFPPAVMAAHVTRWGERPMAFACAVALSGRFGIDLDLRALDDEETATLRRAVDLARRTQDLVQFGELFRLVSPVEGEDRSRAALQHQEGNRAVVFAYQLDTPSTVGPPVVPRGLADGVHRVRATTLGTEHAEVTERSGSDLMSSGFDWPLDRVHTAMIWEITRLE